MLSSREIAILFWLGVAAVWVLASKKTRTEFGGVAQQAASPAISIPLVLLFGYIALECWVGSWLELWDSTLTKDTLVWAIVSGVVLFFKFGDASKERHYFRSRMLATVGITEFMTFFADHYVLSLPAELVLQPVLAFLAMLMVVARYQRGHEAVSRLLGRGLAVLGVAFVVAGIAHVVVTFGRQTLLEFALPIWLTIGLLPFVYAFSLYANYQYAFKGIDWGAKQKPWRHRFRAKLALVLKFRLRSRDSHRFPWHLARSLVDAQSLAEARQILDLLEMSREQQERAVIVRQDRLRRYAGSDDVDEDGRRLDRREFDETKAALHWIATCQMGWYRNPNRDERYRGDLLDTVLQNDFTKHGLPKDSGIVMRVSEDGQAWYAWRRTVSGWCFAIGASGGPPNQWEYDGPEPPTDFPGEDDAWGDSPWALAVRRNW